MLRNMKSRLIIGCIIITNLGCNQVNNSTGYNEHIPGNVYEYTDNIEPRWISFENITGSKGRGGMENNGAKGHPSDIIKAGETKTMLDIEGPGLINRMWFTISNRTPVMLRGLIFNIYWDNENKPAVSVPFGDFFGVGLGETAIYENALFANPEGRSFNCFARMPFKKAAKIEIVNETDIDLDMIFYDIDLQLLKKWDENYLYFHSFWHRDTATRLAKDFEILPRIEGKGRFLGTNMCINANPIYAGCWWGEGEVKIYINGDDEYPTLVGTGTEDYIGTGWGQGKFFNEYTGCLIADSKNLQWAFYRYHIPDPVYFKSDCRVTMQQIGGSSKEAVAKLQKQGVNLIPVTVSEGSVFHHIYDINNTAKLDNVDLPDNFWANFYRSDDLVATAYFYLNSPKNDLPGIQPLDIRIWNLKVEK
jgi:hypothetical protein